MGRRAVLVAILLAIPIVASAKSHPKKASTAPAPAPAASADAVRVSAPALQKLTLQQKKGTVAAYVIDPDHSLRLDLVGPGKLTMYLHQLLPVSGAAAKKGAAVVVVDGKKGRKVALNTQVLKGTSLVERTDVLASTPKTEGEKLKGGAHTVDVAAPKDGASLLLIFDYLPNGAKAVSPIVEETGTKQRLLAAAAAIDDGDEVPVSKPASSSPPPPAPKPEPVAAREPPPSAPSDAAPAAVDTLLDQVKRRIAAGEIKDGLLDSRAPVTVIKADTKEKLTFYRVAAEESFAFMVSGPGEVTVRLHPLMSRKRDVAEGQGYSLAMLENDVILQHLRGTTKRSTTWRMEGGLADLAPPLSEPREYKLKVGPQVSRFAFQIAEDPEGMIVRYEFAPDAERLASMMVAVEDDELGAAAAPMQPTMVMEVDLADKVVIEQREGFLSLMAQGGGFLPLAGGDPGVLAGVQVTSTLPFAHRMLLVSVQGLFMRHTLGVSVGDPQGGAIAATSTVYAVPVLGKLTVRRELGGARFAGFVHVGGGVCYTSASRTALGAQSSVSKLGWAARAGGGAEMDVGAGWLGLEAAYLYAPAADLGQVLSHYSPTGPSLALQYRVGF